jgi:thioredoxin reductase (NADPH)
MTEQAQVDIAVIGGGIAGLVAAQQALEGGCTVAHFMGSEPIGGLVCNIGALSGYPAGSAPVGGIDLAIGILSVNAEMGVIEIPDDASMLERDGAGFRITHDNGSVRARQVIAATGARLAMLDVPGAAELAGRGVSQCAWCDGPLHKDKHTVIVGGGDSALEEALHLSDYAARVTILAREEGFRARRALADRVANQPNISCRFECDVVEINGSVGVEGIKLHDRTKGTSEVLGCDGVFVFIGLEPNSALLTGFAQLDPQNAVVTDGLMETSTPGLFAVGAVRSGYGGRLVQAVGEAATAAMAAVSRCT